MKIKVGLLVACAVALVGIARAGKFDETIKAPVAPTRSELEASIRDYFNTYARVNAQFVGGIVRDKVAHAKWFDARWRLGTAIERWKSPVELAEYGITPNGDGSYAIDIVRFPQWDPLDSRLTELLDPKGFEMHAQHLKAMGFRDSDLEQLSSYIATHRPERLAIAENLSLVESFGEKVHAADLGRKKIQDSQVQSFRYQRHRNSAEATRQWAEGLLDSVDYQRQRILTAYFMERESRMTMLPDPPDELDRELADFRSGEYVRALEAERKRMEETPP